MRESFLDREKWKVVNPSQKLYESQQPGKIEYSQNVKSKAKKISDDEHDLFGDLDGDE